MLFLKEIIIALVWMCVQWIKFMLMTFAPVIIILGGAAIYQLGESVNMDWWVLFNSILVFVIVVVCVITKR